MLSQLLALLAVWLFVGWTSVASGHGAFVSMPRPSEAHRRRQSCLQREARAPAMLSRLGPPPPSVRTSVRPPPSAPHADTNGHRCTTALSFPIHLFPPPSSLLPAHSVIRHTLSRRLFTGNFRVRFRFQFQFRFCFFAFGFVFAATFGPPAVANAVGGRCECAAEAC
ncbi:unnamed protein product [Protopolystoma xenopodis]|uniref:Secreted protein n=1 Tax=Protopolystoma xenopodis TaxID=117903 RepID=A0A448XAI1_9PLAT|nr:unnamed protein product [Protopolystoma xenopodis]